MGRPPTIRDETIIDAAREVFLARGIRATTAEVAERAGVSEGSIFHRFKTKPELFAAAMRSQIDEPAWAKTLEARAGRGDVRDVMIDVGLDVISFYRTILPLMMMSWSNPARDGLPAESPGDAKTRAAEGSCTMSGETPPPLRSLRRVVAFFEAEVAARRIASAAPEVLGRAFLGGLHNFVFLELLDGGTKPDGLTAEAFVREHVRLLWNGIAP